jgi:hypothetical protein
VRKSDRGAVIVVTAVAAFFVGCVVIVIVFVW